jgi:hypothetical protein
VHEHNSTHYFYWDWDLYKPFDYEPIIVHSNSDSTIVLSRFHWHVATIWTEPINEENKPVVGFVKLIHTPIVKSKSEDFRYFEFEPNIPVKERIAITDYYLPIFLRFLKSFKFNQKQDCKDLIIMDKVPKKYLFELADVRSAFLIGHFPKPEELPEALKQKLWPE